MAAPAQGPNSGPPFLRVKQPRDPAWSPSAMSGEDRAQGPGARTVLHPLPTAQPRPWVRHSRGLCAPSHIPVLGLQKASGPGRGRLGQLTRDSVCCPPKAESSSLHPGQGVGDIHAALTGLQDLGAVMCVLEWIRSPERQSQRCTCAEGYSVRAWLPQAWSLRCLYLSSLLGSPP